MFELPKPPVWEGMHPLIVHIPVAVLMIVPLFIIIGIIWRDKAKCHFTVALILMVIGTIGTYFSVASGEAAMQLAKRSEEINSVLADHETLAMWTRTIFSILTIIYIALIVFLYSKKEINPKITSFIHLIFLGVYCLGVFFLTLTGHQGARLVHEFGIQSIM